MVSFTDNTFVNQIYVCKLRFKESIMFKSDCILLMRNMMQRMLIVRKFEEKVERLFAEKKAHGTTHLGIGEEAAVIGTTSALEKEDIVLTTHRGHGQAVGRGVDISAMMAEILGKKTGTNKGVGGSMHISDIKNGVLCANGIVGANAPLACGAALSIKLKRSAGRVAVSFLGDGALNEGAVHEAMNLASVWKLPIIFVIINNKYGMSMPIEKAVNETDLSKRAAAYGIKSFEADGNDILKVYKTAKEAREYVLEKGMPAFIVENTYRTCGHSKSDKNLYRTEGEIENWRKRDPIGLFSEYLQKNGIMTKEDICRMAEKAEHEIEKAYDYAASSPDADELPWVWSGEEKDIKQDEQSARAGDMEIVPYSEAIRQAMCQAMRRDENVFLIGEDVGKYGGAFGVSKGMLSEFGESRVIDTPISETAYIGASVGAAMTGMKPIAEIMFSDFSAVCFDQIVNQAAKMHFMSGGEVDVPLVIRMASGGGTGAAAQHSQSIEQLFCHVPGLKVVCPSTPYDAKGLMSAAIEDKNCVIFLEPKMLYKECGEVPLGEYTIPLGKADIKREGRDVTIITYGRTVKTCLEAAKNLSPEIEAEVIDLRTLNPLDKEAVIKSVKKTGRAVIVHEAVTFGGFGGEIAGAISESEAFFSLKAPIKRIGAENCPVPSAAGLEKSIFPDEKKIESAVRELLS